MAQTITEKILAKASGKTSTCPGEFLWTKVDVLMSHDPCSPGVIGIFKREFAKEAKIWDKERHVMIPDHFIYTTDKQANENVALMRDFADEQDHTYFYDTGGQDYKGVCHITLAQEGHNRPGEVLVGTDSHTVTSGAFGTFAIGVGNTDAAFVLGTGEIFLRVPESIKIMLQGEMPKHLMAKDIILAIIRDLTVKGATYKAIEFDGELTENLSVEERMTLCNMVVECGAKNGIIKPNQSVIDYLSDRTEKSFDLFKSDPDARYEHRLVYEVSKLDAYVSKPHSPDNVSPVHEITGAVLDRAYIGSCTGGKLTDFIAAAKVLIGNKVRIPTLAVPATREVLREIITTKIKGSSVYEILTDAGVKISSEPSCAACCGGPPDTFGRLNEPLIAISTTNRNFHGRMGHKESQIFLASPYTVASSAIRGCVADPRDFIN